MKVYLDPGHGGSDPGAVGNGLQEKEVVLDIAKKIQVLLLDYTNVSVKMSRHTDITKSLIVRTNEANYWGADIFVSIHCNAFNGKARGYEDFIYNRLAPHSITRKYQATLHSEIMKYMNLPDRGMKQANFHVLRESRMPAILTENGFIDHPEDAALMKQVSWRDKVARGHVEGLVSIFGLKKKVPSQATYTVFSGSFVKQENAEGRVLFLQAKGFPAQIKKATVEGRITFRVQVGNFADKYLAEQILKELNTAGIDGFILKTDGK